MRRYLRDYRCERLVNRHRTELLNRPALQGMYEEWAIRIKRHLPQVEGRRIELGCGSGALSQHLPNFIITDIGKQDWIDEVVDACNMPYKDSTCASIVAVDVLHHLPDLTSFFDEVQRTLKIGGRLILLEPYISIGSYWFYRFLHHEPLDMKVSAFAPVLQMDKLSGGPCNEALPTLAFVRQREQFNKRWPSLKITKSELSDMIVYPLTGGFSKPALIPASLVKPLARIEHFVLKFIGRFAALRILVVIEKGY